MNISDIFIIAIFVIALIIAGLFYLNKKSMRKMVQAQEFIDHNGITTNIFVIDKKQEKPTATNMQKGVYEQLPKSALMKKANLVMAKVNGQIVTLMCDKSVYEIITPKKNVKVELAGAFITKVVGMNLENKKNKTFSEKMAIEANKAMKK